MSFRPRPAPLLRLRRTTKFLFLFWATVAGGIAGRIRHRSPEKRDLSALRWGNFWMGGTLRALDVKVTVHGTPMEGPGLYLPNHMGYLDLLLMSHLRLTWFVMKEEVMSWPVAGTALRFYRHPVVSRRISTSMAGTSGRLQEIFANGQLICPFVEGTSTGGDRLLPFRAALLQPAIDAGVPVQPVAIVWSCADPSVDVAEEIAYWREEHTLAPHFWRLLGMDGIAADVAFGEPIPTAGRERRELAEDVRLKVAALMNSLGATPAL